MLATRRELQVCTSVAIVVPGTSELQEKARPFSTATLKLVSTIKSGKLTKPDLRPCDHEGYMEYMYGKPLKPGFCV